MHSLLFCFLIVAVMWAAAWSSFPFPPWWAGPWGCEPGSASPPSVRFVRGFYHSHRRGDYGRQDDVKDVKAYKNLRPLCVLMSSVFFQELFVRDSDSVLEEKIKVEKMVADCLTNCYQVCRSVSPPCRPPFFRVGLRPESKTSRSPLKSWVPGWISERVGTLIWLM